MRGIGFSYGTPWKPSITCGPDAPRPRMNRPPLTKSHPAAVWAMHEAVREYTLTMPVPISTRSVLAARYPIWLIASKRVRLGDPHDVEPGRFEIGHALDVGVEVARVVDHHRQLHGAGRYVSGRSSCRSRCRRCARSSGTTCDGRESSGCMWACPHTAAVLVARPASRSGSCRPWSSAPPSSARSSESTRRR